MAIKDFWGNLKNIFSDKPEKQKIIPDDAIDTVEDYSDLGDLIAPIFREIPAEPKILELIKDGVSSWAFIAISAVADEIATNEYKLYKRQGADEWIDFDEHPFLDLFEKPNPVQTKEEFLWLLGVFYLAGGEAPILMDSPRNPTTMFLLNPERLKIIWDEKKIIKEYEYLKSNGQKEIIAPELIVMMKLPSVNSPFRGCGVLKYIAKTLDLDAYIEDYLNMFFFNSALPTGVLETDQELNDDIARRLKLQFETRHRGVKNAHKLAVLEKGLKFNNTSFKLNEIQIKELSDSIRDKIFATFRLPKSIVGIVEDVNRSNAETSDITFSKRAVLPKLRFLQGQINQFILPKFGDGENLWFEFEDPTPDDKKYDAEVYQIYLNSGVMLQNEVREELGLDPMDENEMQRFQELRNPMMQENPEEEDKEKKKKPKKEENEKKGYHKNPGKINRFKGVTKKTVVVDTKKIESLEGAMKGIIKSMLNNKKKGFTERQKEVYHEQKIFFSERLEAEFKQDLGIFFEREKKVVLAQAKGMKAENKEMDIDLDKEKETELLIEMGTPYYEKAIELQSSLTYALLGKDEFLSTKDELVKRFIDENVKKYSTSVFMTTNDDIKRIVENWAKEDKPLTELRNALKEYFDKASIKRAEQIARTEISRANGFATTEVYRQAGIVGKQWITAKDELTCPACSMMDGKIIPMNRNFWNKGETLRTVDENGKLVEMDFSWGSVASYPLHVSCRCDLIPIFYQEEIPANPFSYKKNKEADRIKEAEEKEEHLKVKELELIEKESKLVVKEEELEKEIKEVEELMK